MEAVGPRRRNAEIESSAEIRERMIAARACQSERFSQEKGVYSNAQMPPKLIRKCCATARAQNFANPQSPSSAFPLARMIAF